MPKRIILCVTLLSSVLHLSAQIDQSLLRDSINTILYEYDYLNDQSPGLAIGVVQDGQIVYEKYMGMANLSHSIKVDKNTRFNIASTAKQFTALMILQLSMEGKLSLEDDVRKYLPTLYPNVKESIRLRQIINHTSGIRNYVELMDLNGKVWWKRVGLDNNDVIELIENQEDLSFTPGTRYTYSNSGYNILTKVIENVTGQKFNDYSLIFFQQLGMENTSFIKRYMEVIPNKAEPYSDWGRGEWWVVPTVTKTNGEGFLFTTLQDQLTYEIAVQNANENSNSLLSKSQKPIANSEIKSYGFGLKLEDRMGRKAVHHDGVTYSYHSQVIRFPEEKLTIFIMSNNGNISSERIANRIASLYLPKEKPTIEYSPWYSDLTNQKEDTPIEGLYNYPDKETIVSIQKVDGKWYWKDGNNFTIEMIEQGPASYYFTYDPELKVVFYPNEMVEYYPSGKTKVYARNNDLPASITDLEGIAGTYLNEELALSFELKLSDDNQLKMTMSNDKNEMDTEVLNRNAILVDDYMIHLKRDAFDRVTSLLLTYGRAANISFQKKSNLNFVPKIRTKNGSIQVTTIGSRNGDSSDILLTENYSNGNEIWSNQFGGKSYDKASSILATDDGYLIVGSTSSYGVGNYDMFVIKTDKHGKKIWQNTYGEFYNDFGYYAEKTENGYLIKGTQQHCTSNTDVFDRECTTNVWFVNIDKNGKQLSSQLLEEI